MMAGNSSITTCYFNDGVFEVITTQVQVDRNDHRATSVDKIFVIESVCIIPSDALGSICKRNQRQNVVGRAGVNNDVVVMNLVFRDEGGVGFAK